MAEKSINSFEYDQDPSPHGQKPSDALLRHTRKRSRTACKNSWGETSPLKFLALKSLRMSSARVVSTGSPPRLGFSYWSRKLPHFSKILQFFGGLVLGCIKTKFARKYAFDCIFQALQDLHTFAPLQSQIFRKKSV